jgi:hypothetical protein
MDDVLEIIRDQEDNEQVHGHLEDEELPFNRREPRQPWDRSNPMIEYSKSQFKKLFRFSKQNFSKIVYFV